MWQTNDFRDWLLSLRQRTETGWIRIRVHLLDQLESNEIENEGLLVQDHDHHILSELDVHNKLIGIKRDLCPILFLVIIPNNNFVPLLLVDQHYDVGFVHHFNESNILPQILHLLL